MGPDLILKVDLGGGISLGRVCLNELFLKCRYYLPRCLTQVNGISGCHISNTSSTISVAAIGSIFVGPCFQLGSYVLGVEMWVCNSARYGATAIGQPKQVSLKPYIMRQG
jgi:hypothetical protein